MSKRSANYDTRRNALQAAMNRLFAAKKIRTENTGDRRGHTTRSSKKPPPEERI